jgi:hypothetical protein
MKNGHPVDVAVVPVSGCAPKTCTSIRKDHGSGKRQVRCEEAAVPSGHGAGNMDMINQRIRECMEIKG